MKICESEDSFKSMRICTACAQPYALSLDQEATSIIDQTLPGTECFVPIWRLR